MAYRYRDYPKNEIDIAHNSNQNVVANMSRQMPSATSTKGVSWSVNTPAGKVTLIGSNCPAYHVAVIKDVAQYSGCRLCLIGGRRRREGWGRQ